MSDMEALRVYEEAILIPRRDENGNGPERHPSAIQAVVDWARAGYVTVAEANHHAREAERSVADRRVADMQERAADAVDRFCTGAEPILVGCIRALPLSPTESEA